MAEPFPAPDDTNISSSPNASLIVQGEITNRPAASSSLGGRLRRASQSFGQTTIPKGFSAATGDIASSIFSGQITPRTTDIIGNLPSVHLMQPEEDSLKSNSNTQQSKSTRPTAPTKVPDVPPTVIPFPNGYHFPPKHSCAESTKLGGIAFFNYALTPVGFIVILYGLNVVAWGGMLFLLLCNASPAMCHPSCNDINSPRRKWIEYDSQILNALFCVTGFGLAPWRFRDLYFLLQYRVMKNTIALRRLAGIHRGWFRLQGSTELPVILSPQNVGDAAGNLAIPYPENKIPDPPLTGMRAPATIVWKLDFVIWLMVWNTLLQCVLSGFMWGMNRYNRPSWSTGLFVALACIVAALGGIIMFLEGKSVKSVEGVSLSEQDKQRLEKDRELGVWHYNNIKDKKMEEKHEL
ncbi:hypothetical protein PT974_10242 [Cladobotryum mycophilum]|uniref:Alpha-L-rhamnosidase C n=1 Tax=Cladobotryum mycophilum TaxID=491253 RepID=A0ABR0S9G8_9HYPO